MDYKQPYRDRKQVRVRKLLARDNCLAFIDAAFQKYFSILDCHVLRSTN